MRILVTGSNGQLGSELRKIQNDYKYYDWLFTNSGDLDITDKESVIKFFENDKIDICINCAAYTAVDKAENNEDTSRLINTEGVLNLVKACEEHKTTLIHISTDYVFDGYSSMSYNEDDRTNPLNVYGKTKKEGEINIIESDCSFIIIRTSWLYSSFGNNFVKTMLRLGSEKKEIKVINDQTGSPTFASDLANAIMLIIDNNKKNYIREIFHYCNEGCTNWFEFSKKIFEYSNKEVKVIPISTEEFGSKVKRPSYSVLDTTKIKNQYNIEIPNWEESLKRCLEEINKN